MKKIEQKQDIKKEKKLFKTGNLETFLSDNRKLYFKKKTLLSIAPLEKITEKKYPKLFWFLYNNWDKILDAYFWGNKGNLQKMKPVKFIIPEDKFSDITENIKGKFDTITIAFSKLSRSFNFNL